VLVLTRRAGESIVIGDDVRVVVLDVRGDTVRLGIDAPRSVQVHRAEVYAEVQAANAAALSSSTEDLGSVATRLTRMVRPAPQRRAGTASDATASDPATGAAPANPTPVDPLVPAAPPESAPTPAEPPAQSPAQPPVEPPAGPPVPPPGRPKPGPPPRKP
jgi:carbon storage regulator